MSLRIRSITSGCSGKEPTRRPDTRQRRKSNLVWGLIFPTRTRKKINASRTDQQYCKTAKSFFRKLVTCINLQDLSVLYRHLYSNWTQRQKVIGFASTTIHDWVKKNKLGPHFHPISYTFTRFASATCDFFEFWLVHCVVCVLCDWLGWFIRLRFNDTQLKPFLWTYFYYSAVTKQTQIEVFKMTCCFSLGDMCSSSSMCQ